MKSYLKILILVLSVTAFPVSGISLLDGMVSLDEGNATIHGVNGYIVIPSAEPAWSDNEAMVTVGYSANLAGSFSHLPYLQLGLNNSFEFVLSADVESDAAIMLNGKWRIDKKGSRSLAIGVNSQLLNIPSAIDWAAQIYAVSTFSSTFIDWPAKTTLMVGYTLSESLSTDIDYGMGFQTTFMKDLFNEKVDFLLDFGNISYCANPNVSDATNRGMVNLGFRLLPLKLADQVYLSGDLRALDILDSSDRGLSIGIGLSYNP